MVIKELLRVVENDGIRSDTGRKAFEGLTDKLVKDVDNGNLVDLLAKLETCAQDSSLSDADDGNFEPDIAKVMRRLSELSSCSYEVLFSAANELYVQNGWGELSAPDKETPDGLAHHLLVKGFACEIFTIMKNVVESLINPAPEG